MKITVPLLRDWRWRRVGEDAWHPGQVPGSVLADMFREGLCTDPFWRTNEFAVRELFAFDYEYKTTFSVDVRQLAMDDVQLVFEGIDTIADIELNGTPIAHVNDMHRTHRFPVKPRLKPGENTLRVVLHSPLAFIRAEDAANDIHYASTGCLHGNGALRKAHYMFGWDWGPQLPDAGLFRPVSLVYADIAVLSDVHVRQKHCKGAVSIPIEAAVERLAEIVEPLTLNAALTAPDGTVTRMSTQFTEDRSALTIPVPDPELWWPNGLGSQPLYTLDVELSLGDERLDAYCTRLGLRTITVDTSKDDYGNRFAFVVNGIPIFAMGANYIPQDNVLSRVTQEKQRRLVQDCAAANFNMLRVWGGGYYPDDVFYDACDEYGILLWQDLMFACNVYALTPDFEQNIVAETRDNVRRLRDHASLALWCGNNEMEWGWGEGWARLQGHSPRYKADYLKIFEMILARTVAAEDPDAFWWPSSPSSGGAFDEPNSPDRGDQHYWEVWHSGKPFTEYRKSHFRFCSEYGFQSFPGEKTLHSFTLPEDRNIFSEVLESHQKNGTANSKILTYIAEYFRYPKDLASVAYISQVLQYKAIQYGVEHWRQNRGRCMGSLYWQLNDCWPVASWASIDYYGRWKALHYGARHFYAPLMASAREAVECGSRITYYIHNDTLSPQACRLEIVLLDTALSVLYNEKRDVVAEPLTATPVLEFDFAAYLPDAEARRSRFARYRLYQNGEMLSEGITMFIKPKHFALPKVCYDTRIEEHADRFQLTLKSDGFSYYTSLEFADCDPALSDNFFSITDPQGVAVDFPCDGLNFTAEQLLAQLTIRSVRDSYTMEEG